MKKLLYTTIAILSFANFTMAQVPDYVPTNGLVGYWPFNGNANDESGNGNNGTVNGAVLVSDRKGASNKAYSFDGNSDYIDCGNSTELNIFGDITISVWMLANNLSGDHGIVSKMNTSNQPTYDLITSGNQIRWGTTNGPFQFSNGILTNTWINVTAIFDRQKQTKSLFINGEFEAEIATNNSNIPINNDNLFIGAHQPANVSSWSWNGIIDDVCIWNRTLTSKEIKNLFLNCSKTIVQQPMNQSMFSGNAKFSCLTNDTLVNYQWQSDLGMGWNNLSNAGQYIGTTTNSLEVTNVTSTNNNQKFRCVIKGDCLTDTTKEATLKVWGLSIKDEVVNKLKVYPNPASTLLNIVLEKPGYYVAKLSSVTGQSIITPTSGTIDISALANGVYILTIYDSNNKLISTNKVSIIK